MENPKVCQEVLRVILEDKTLEVISSIPQRDIKNLRGRSVRMDVLCRLEDGRLSNVEVQTSKNDEGGRRDMCEIVESMLEERNIKQVKILFENGASLEAVFAAFSNLSKEDILKIYRDVTGERV